MAEVVFDDERLQKLFESMTYEQRLKAVRGAFRRAGNKVRKVAVNNLRASGIRSSRNLEKGIRVSLFKKKAGFKVTILHSIYTNHQGRKKPVLTFAEGGTTGRYTKANFFRGRRAKYTGKMRKYGFMEKTLTQTKDSVTEELHDEIANTIIKDAQKYGCR